MLTRLVVFLIRGYQLTWGTVLPRSCRFYPTCSEYALEAVSRHGVRAGTWLALKRLLRCHPLNPGGYDPVPGKTSVKQRMVGR